MKQINENDIRILLEELRESLPRKECLTCECLQGFIAQLEVDSYKEILEEFKEFKIPEKNLHSCLGCKPCPLADVYVKYLKIINDCDAKIK